MRRVLLTHYDLDGIGSDILLSSLYGFEKKYYCGYSKVKDHIDNRDLWGYDSCVVSDICLTPDQYKSLSHEYGDKLFLVDHHLGTKESTKLYNNNSKVIYSTKFCATALIFQSFYKKLRDYNCVQFVSAVDAYDCWRHKTYPEMFSKGYDLNILFWDYNYLNFYKRFFGNISLNYNQNEIEVISNHKKKRDNSIKNSDMNAFGSNSVFVMNCEPDFVNDYSLQFSQYDIYFMLYISKSGDKTISVRTTLENVSIGEVLNDIKKDFFDVKVAGGHDQAGGIGFKENTFLDNILNVVEHVNNRLESFDDKKLPF